MSAPMRFLCLCTVVAGERFVQLSQRERLKELIASLRHTHGGPSFVAPSELERLSMDAFREVGSRPSATEDEYVQLCHRVVAGLDDQCARPSDPCLHRPSSAPQPPWRQVRRLLARAAVDGDARALSRSRGAGHQPSPRPASCRRPRMAPRLATRGGSDGSGGPLSRSTGRRASGRRAAASRERARR